MNRFFITILFLCVATPVFAWIHGQGATQPPITNSFSPLKTGGGGWVVGADVQSTGVVLARTDVAFGYIRGSDKKWYNLITKASMPSANFGYFPTTGTSQKYQGSNGGGIVEVAASPSDSTMAAMFYAGQVFVSTNVNPSNPTALSWCNATGTGFAANNSDSSNSVWRQASHKMAIDPANRDHIIVGTATQGLFETKNATACASATWTAISTAQVPLSNASGSNYNIAFDPTSGTSACGSAVCTNIIYIYSSNATSPGLYHSTNAGSTYSIMSGTPSTLGAASLVVDPVSGTVWLVDVPGGANATTNGNVWKVISGTFTQVLTAGYHSVAINPSNHLQIVAVTNSGTINVSTDGGSTWGGIWAFLRDGGDSPWQANIALGTSTLSTGNLFFDTTASSSLLCMCGQGVWASSLPSANNFTWTNNSDGIEEAIGNLITVAKANTPTAGSQDVSTFTYNTLNNQNAVNNFSRVAQSRALSYTSGQDSPPGDSSGFMVAKSSQDFNAPDYSGYSSDFFQTSYVPFNTWNARVAPAALANNGSGLIRVTVPSTSGLATWSAGQGSLLCSMAYSVVPNTNFSAGQNIACFAVTVVDATHFDLVGTTFSSAFTTIGGDYLFWAPSTTAMTSLNGTYNVTGATSSAGKIQIEYMYFNSNSLTANVPVCVSGIGAGSTVEANGCWITQSVSTSTIPPTAVLGPSSTFTNAYDPTKAGGVMQTWQEPGGNIAAASQTNFVMIAGNRPQAPLCTTDGGATWTALSSPRPVQTTLTGGPYAAGTTAITVASGSGLANSSTILHIPMEDGRDWVTRVATGGGTTSLTVNTPIPTGRSVAAGANVYVDTGWAFAAFLSVKQVVADQLAANTFFAVNSNFGLYKWTNCNPMTLVNSDTVFSGTWQSGGGNNFLLKTIPGESGHLFYTAGRQGGECGAVCSTQPSHPSNTSLWRSCNGDSNSAVVFSRVSGMFEPRVFGYGAAAPGKSYPALYIIGWYDPADVRANAVFGIWRSTDDANHGNSGASATCSGGNTWTRIDDWPVGWMSSSSDIQGDPSVYGEVYTTGNAGSQFGMFNFLLKRDIDPASNDNDPMWLEKVG